MWAVTGRSFRTLLKWTIIANLAGIAILLIGWAADSGVLLTLGFIVLVASLGSGCCPIAGSRRRPSSASPLSMLLWAVKDELLTW